MQAWSNDDRKYMAKAIELAARGIYSTQPNPRVGCVLVNDGVVVGEGFHVRAGEGHAEVNALQAAGELAKGATAYVTLEPCSHQGKTPPCANALLDAGVSRVVAAMQDPNPVVTGRGLQRLSDAGVDVQCGLLESQARQLNPGFIQRMSKGRPLVRLKMATSMDGRTAMASGESQWITGPGAREDVQSWRARSSAILTGVGTVQDDDPKLTVRSDDLLRAIAKQPARVVLDAKCVLLGGESVFANNADVFYFSGNGVEPSSCIQGLAHVECIQSALSADGYFELDDILIRLAEREVNELLLEVGAGLAGAFLNQQCVDELLLYMAPKLMGSDARALANLPFDHMSEAIELQLEDMRVVGDDLRFHYRVKR